MGNNFISALASINNQLYRIGVDLTDQNGQNIVLMAITEGTMQAIIESLEKQISKTVYDMYMARMEELPGQGIVSGSCPACGSPVPKKHYYCWKCGQRLIWPKNQ